MIIQYTSDLHLEFPENKNFLKTNPIQALGDVLLLTGDIVPFAVMDKHADFFDFLSDNFKTTYWIPGNHEYYYFDLAKKCGVLNENIRNNVHLVNNLSIIQDDVRFIFSTLWTKISPANHWKIERSLSDFHVIKYNNKRFTIEEFNQLHQESIAFIEHELQLNHDGKTVVATHHVPTFVNYPEQYKGDALNEAFAVELFDMIYNSKINYWVFGHHHHNREPFKLGNTNMLTNQLGYVAENEHVGYNNKYFETNNFEIQYNKAIFAQ